MVCEYEPKIKNRVYKIDPLIFTSNTLLKTKARVDDQQLCDILLSLAKGLASTLI